MRILIAENDPVSRWLTRKALAELGHEIVEAEDGHAAWEALCGPSPPELAVLGWMLPGVDGIELCRRVREEPRLAGTFVILLTVKCGKANQQAAAEAGADDFVGRPFRADDLCARARLGLRIATLQKGGVAAAEKRGVLAAA